MTDPIKIYLDPTGDDRHDGVCRHKESPQRGPVATPKRAQELVRDLRAAHPGCPITVYLAGGRYPLSAPLIFGPEDGGTAQAPVTWAALPGERPILSGGRHITGWRPGEMNGIACLTASVPEAVDAAFNPLQLFVDGRRSTRPRLPRAGWHHFVSTFGKSRPPGAEWGTGPDEAEYAPGHLRSFRQLQDVRIVAMGPWFEMPMRVLEIDEDRRAVRFHRHTWDQLVDEKRDFCRYFADNVAEAFGEPGDWYLDRAAGVIHYIPLPGQTADSITAIAPAVEHIAIVRGSDKQPVRNLRFENLCFRHADWHPPDDYRGSIQAGHLCPGAILFEKAEQCTMYGCEVSQVGQFAIELGVGSHDCRVVACSLFDLGGGGVRVDHEWLHAHSHEVHGDPAGERGIERPRAATITDCRIHHAGRIHFGAVGIYVGNASFCRILHNEITEMRYSGISVGWMWGHGPTATSDNRIEFNHVHHINMEKYFSDLGLIYTLGTQPGSTIRNNLLHHVESYGYGGNGVYTDEGSSQIVIENNIAHHCHATGYGGGQRDVVVRNNIFAWCSEYQVAAIVTGQDSFSTVLERNLITWRTGTCGNGWDPLLTITRDNILWAHDIPLKLTDGHDIAYWQKQGSLLNTLVADPLLVDPDGGDYRLREGSPAIAHGFAPIDVSRCGPRGGESPLPATFDHWLAKHPDAEPDRPILFARMNQTKPGIVELRIENRGRVPASARYRLDPPAGLDLVGEATISIHDLPPGQAVVRDIAFSAATGIYRLGIWPDAIAPGLTPAFCIVQTAPRTITIHRLRKAPAVEEIAARLATTEEHLLTHGQVPKARVRFALAEDQFLLLADVIDARVSRGPALASWEGSTIEVFIAPGFRGVPGQLVFSPDRLAGDVRVHRQERKFVPEPQPQIPVRFELRKEGYRLTTRIPLERFGLEPDATMFRFELTVNLFLNPSDKSPEKLRLIGADEPWSNTRGMASATVGDAIAPER